MGCYITHHSLGVLKQQKFISHSSGAGGLTSRCGSHSLVRTCFLMHRRPSSRCVVMWGRGEGAPGVLSDLHPTLRGSTLKIYSCLPTLTSYYHVDIRVSAHEFRGTQVLGSSSLQDVLILGRYRPKY